MVLSARYYLSFRGGRYQQILTKGALFRIPERGIIIEFIRATHVVVVYYSSSGKIVIADII